MDYVISHQLRRMRTELGYSQEYLACKLNISQSTYSEIENDHVGVSLNKLNRIAEVLGKNPLELIQINGRPLNLAEHNNAAISITELQHRSINQFAETLLRLVNLVENKLKI